MEEPAAAEILTIVTIAQDEQHNIGRCIESTRGLGRHIVVDGGSRDGTKEIATSLGATVCERRYDYPARQYNFGIEQCTTPWVLILDADEAVGEDLRRSLVGIRSWIERHPEAQSFEIARRNYFMERLVRHSSWYPDYNQRLLERANCRYEDREVHARVITGGAVGRLDGHIEHLTYTSIDQYLRKLTNFTRREVAARVRDRASFPGRDAELKARVRAAWLRLPFRPFTRFIFNYFVRSGFRDGRLGLDLAINAAFYEHVVSMRQRYEDPAHQITTGGPDAAVRG